MLLAADYAKLDPDATLYLKISLGVYVVFLLVVSVVASKKVTSEEDYAVAGRRLPLVLAWGTLMATWFGAATMFGACGSARNVGLSGPLTLDPIGCSAALVFAGLFFAKPIWRMKLLTMGDFFRQKYGPRAEILASSIQVPSYFGWIALQYTALGGILSFYFEMSLTQGILVAAAVTLLYTMIGGMWSVTLTDSLQIVIALVGLLTLAYRVFSSPELGDGSAIGGVAEMITKVGQTHPGHLTIIPGTLVSFLAWLSFLCTGLFGCIPGQDLQQRVFAAQDEKTASRACILAGVFYFIFGMIPVALGLASLVTHPPIAGAPRLDDKQLIAQISVDFLSTPMLVTFIIALVAMIVSTATSAVLAPSSILSRNLLGRISKTAKHSLLRDRMCVVIVAAGGVGLTFIGESLLGLLDIALSIAMVALFVPVVGAIYGKPRGELSALLATSFGFATWIVGYLVQNVFFLPPNGFGGLYHEYIGSLLAPGWLQTIVTNWAKVPLSMSGLALSLFGYFLGQYLCARATRRSK